MITNRNASVIVDGVKTVSIAYKKDEETMSYGNFYVANGRKESLGTDSFVVDGEIVGYCVKQIVLHKSAIYKIAGTVIPGDCTVFVSSGYERANISYLKEHVIASTHANAEGKFEFNNISCEDGVITMWISILPEYTSTTCIEYALTVTAHNLGGNKILVHSFSEPKGEYQEPLFTISGTCTRDIDRVYISRAESDANIDLLVETLCDFADVSAGAFKIECSGEYELNYVVWCLTQRNGTFTVDSILVSADTKTCLSGDTLITMADGTQKRLDNLEIGEEVLIDNGATSRIHTIKRGYWSDFHTLYYFEDGTIIDETHPHRFYNVDQGFWQRLQNWKLGDHGINVDGKKVAMTDKKRIEEKTEMFGIWTDSGTYYANGLLSGAAFCNKKILEEASAEQAVDMMLSADESWLLQLMGLEGELP